MDEAVLRQIRHRIEEELRQREIAFLEFWLQEVKNIDAKRHKELSGLQSDLKKLLTRMETRLQTLKKGGK
jgi:hypothetical protein